MYLNYVGVLINFGLLSISLPLISLG